MATALRLVWAEHWICLVVGLGCAWAAWRAHRKAARLAGEIVRERRMRMELEAYAELDLSLRAGARGNATEAARALARRVCRTIGEKSVFSRVTMLLRSPEGRFACVGSVGTDDLTIAALHDWGEQVVEEEHGGELRVGARNAAKSFSVALGEWRSFDREVGSWAMSGRKERRRWRRGIVVPIRFGVGRMAGAIAVCADGAGFDEVVRDEMASGGEPGWLSKAMGPIEALAGRMATAIENEQMAERLVRAEKLAGLGQLAGGVAHALNNPLTAVLGFAELIAEAATESRVQVDARTIFSEALKMKATVGRLIEFWQPVGMLDEAVDVMTMLRELEAACAGKLAERGVRLEIAAADGAPQVRGRRAKLRQVMEHLLNNSAQAIAGSGPRDESEGGHRIRMTVSHDERALHLIVSDTGPGFKEPARVFDPYYTTKAPAADAGMGLSVCYGIVREHGGEISAFNLHPHGAAVVVELPVLKAMVEEVEVLRETVRHHG